MFEKSIAPLGHFIVIGRQLILAEDSSWLHHENAVRANLQEVYYGAPPRLADSAELKRLLEVMRPRPRRKAVAALRHPRLTQSIGMMVAA